MPPGGRRPGAGRRHMLKKTLLTAAAAAAFGAGAFGAGSAAAEPIELQWCHAMTAKGAIKPVYQLMADAGEKFDPNAYLSAVTGYYSTADGKMLSLPFNSS